VEDDDSRIIPMTVDFLFSILIVVDNECLDNSKRQIPPFLAAAVKPSSFFHRAGPMSSLRHHDDICTV
jgi:hypothetical protein